MKLFLFAFIFFLTLFSCRKKELPNETSFYYWKTNYHLTKYEEEYLQEHHVKKIYVRCFDIVMQGNNPIPEHPLLWKDKTLPQVEYIPTVFIKNDVFLHRDTSWLKNLAEKTLRMCNQILSSQQLPLREIQLDCDWTKTTREAYFYFLTYIKSKNLIVSNTLRLYQYKYRHEAGIVPTDFASLMCYNMGNIKDVQAENSILNKKELSSYLSSPSYPKPLNIALPIFHWTLVYQGNTFKGILYDKPEISNEFWKKISSVSYRCIRDYHDISCQQDFFTNDIIRLENISKEDLYQAQEIIQNKVNYTKHEIIYFDLDSSKLAHCLR